MTLPLTVIVNECLSTGPVPCSLKQAIVKPLLKKMSLDLNIPPKKDRASKAACSLVLFEQGVKTNCLSVLDRGPGQVTCRLRGPPMIGRSGAGHRHALAAVMQTVCTQTARHAVSARPVN